MKTFKDIISELTDPTPRRQKEFIDKHTIQVIDYPAGKPDQLSVKNIKKDKTKKASLHDGEDAAVYEETMSDAEMKKREDIVKGMKKNKADFQKRYGDKWKSVMYATATKSAMKEEAELEEASDWIVHVHKPVNKLKAGQFVKVKARNQAEAIRKGAAKHGDESARHGDFLRAKKMNEEAEELDELSKKTLGSYVKKAAKDIKTRAQDAFGEYEYGTSAAGQKQDNKADQRIKGVVKATNKLTKEEVELDEAVEVSHDRYMRSHGKKASGGEGNWMFTHKRMGDANVNDSKEVHSARGKFSDAKKSAQQWAKKHGHSTVYVMEEVALDEAKSDMYHKHMLKALGKTRLPKDHAYTSSIANNGDFVVRDGGGRTVGRIAKDDHNLNEVSDKKLDAYRQKAFADQPSGDDGSDKYRKRKFGRDLAFAKQTGRAKVLATKEEYMDEAFKAGAMKLSDGSSVKLTSEQASTLNALFNELNSSNKKKMEERLMSNTNGFNEILAFAKEAV